ncbi:MAG: glycogen synthase GlgA [Clostridia bacterium]|nr:glycogen synthase GlgA [Clostridia bacterium]
MKKILYVSSECMPFAATGGLGDVIGSLPEAVREYMGDGSDIRVVLPLYENVSSQWRSQMKEEAVFTVRLGWRNQYCGVLSLEKNGVTYYFVDNEYYFKRAELYGHWDDGERFAFFSMAAVQMLSEINYFPDIIHANDWQSALSVVYYDLFFKELKGYENIKTVFTVHNIEYQGKFCMESLNELFSVPWKYAGLLEWEGSMNLMKAAIVSCDRLTTVSPTYAKEILTPEYGAGLEGILCENSYKLCGILNGIDTELYDPHNDEIIAKKYMWRSISAKKIDKTSLQRELSLPERDVPVFAIITRLVSAKGMDLVRAAAHMMLYKNDVQLVMVGNGEKEYEDFFRWLEEAYPEKVKALVTYDRALSRRVYAASDFFIMPSKSEPCGIAQMIASRYGSVPIVRETGGLSDTIKDYSEDGKVVSGNGLTFSQYSPKALYKQIERAVALYGDQKKIRSLQQRVMKIDFSWAMSAEEYADLYDNL